MGQANHKVFTARFDPRLFEELRTIAELQDSSMNQIVVEAVAGRLRQARRRLMGTYEETLERLKAYESRDPDYEDAIAAFVDAETDGLDDPAEGRTVERSDDEQRIEEILAGG